MPILSIIGLWLADLIGKKFLFARQAGKFVLAGAFADVFDIKVFQFLFFPPALSLLAKLISFIFATVLKYISDKYWTFEQHKHENMGGEMTKFFLVAIIGAALNVVSFYFFDRINLGLSSKLWTELSIILAAIASGLWNFLGYKFLVFKK